MVELKVEYPYLKERVGIVRRKVEANLKKAHGYKTDYSHFVTNNFKRQTLFLQNFIDNLESGDLIISDGSDFKQNIHDIQFLNDKHESYDTIEPVITKVRDVLRSSISDPSIEAHRRLAKVIESVKDEFGPGYNHKATKSKVILECNKGFVEPKDVVKETLSYLTKS